MLRFASVCLSLAASLLLSPRTSQAGPFADPGYPVAQMVAWADTAVALVRGPLDVANPELGLASFGAFGNALGPASTNSLATVSLGDGGSMTVGFTSPIFNGPGADFAVYENGFQFPDGLFAELAYVEVSSNGIDFALFPTTALNTAPVASFANLDPTACFGFAGRHEISLGTGFDLAALSNHPLVQSGHVDLLAIHSVRVTDVVGDGSRVDSTGRAVYDPYPTPFAAGGFDLDAVGARFVPEPESARTLASGVLGLGFRRRRSRRGRPGRADAPRIGVVNAIAGLSLPFALALVSAIALVPRTGLALDATFDDLSLAPESFLNGSTLAGGFTSGGVFFENDYDATFGVFSGFAASTTTDATTPGFGNQFSNITGHGAGGSAGFGLAYFAGRVVLPEPQIVLGASFTNTTYAALSMRDGDLFSKKFGGPTGSDPDFFRLLIEGRDANGATTGTAELMLADYRFADAAQDFVLDQWVFLDLTGLGAVKELRFGFESSDVGVFGINTPTYFAIDDLKTIPEPGTALALGLGLALLSRRSRAPR